MLQSPLNVQAECMAAVLYRAFIPRISCIKKVFFCFPCSPLECWPFNSASLPFDFNLLFLPQLVADGNSQRSGTLLEDTKMGIRIFKKGMGQVRHKESSEWRRKGVPPFLDQWVARLRGTQDLPEKSTFPSGTSPIFFGFYDKVCPKHCPKWRCRLILGDSNFPPSASRRTWTVPLLRWGGGVGPPPPRSGGGLRVGSEWGGAVLTLPLEGRLWAPPVLLGPRKWTILLEIWGWDQHSA